MTWNINGLGDKLGDGDVQKLINSYDIVILLETMKGKQFRVNYPGYCCWHFARDSRHKNAKRNSGGFLVMVREHLSKYVQISKKSDYVVWLTLKSGVKATCHAGFVYIPPVGSTMYTDLCPYEVIQNEIVQKRASASIVLAGDFNARTGEMVDFPADRWSNTHQHLTKNRLNGDKTVNTYGKKLIELTISNNMVLLNGRMRSYTRSRNSQFTCFKYNGASAVDYVIADYDILNAVKQFDVKHKTPDSDHCPLTYILNNGYIQTNTQIEKISSTLYLYKWDQKTADQYIESLKSTESRGFFDDFLCGIVDNHLNSNQVVQLFLSVSWRHNTENLCETMSKIYVYVP